MVSKTKSMGLSVGIAGSHSGRKDSTAQQTGFEL